MQSTLGVPGADVVRALLAQEQTAIVHQQDTASPVSEGALEPSGIRSVHSTLPAYGGKWGKPKKGENRGASQASPLLSSGLANFRTPFLLWMPTSLMDPLVTIGSP